MSQALLEAQKRFGADDGRKVFDDFRRQDDPEAPVTTSTSFPFDDPGAPDPAAVANPDLGSIQPRNPVIDDGSSPVPARGGRRAARRRAGARAPRWLRSMRREGISFQRQQSNALLVRADRSQSGRPIAVMGPQVAYYSPQVLMEIDLHGGGIDARGATFPGISLYVLLGRGRNFAWSSTTAMSDNVDEFVERLCEPDGSEPTRESGHYLYKGECRPFDTREHVLRDPAGPHRSAGPARGSCWRSSAASTGRSRAPPRSAARRSRSRRPAPPTSTRSTRCWPTSG